ncbi:hypothetical protein OG455_34565 [Kitasatospora sp. NBC_01287]|uniref:hypothetical protein n=1 Tax=Kitasatospora sp. NBC_01287 TaxID=2903573 RepID=UPI00224D244B|nr:hypothetical protein [Kitasatospora sp. NBC_01287]MCX4750574.1 hypothetical protein [Kitasatospora sp. NBC_01287]
MRTTLTNANSIARILGHRIASRLADARARFKAEPDAGYTTETVIITALLIACGLAAVGYITAKVLAKAKGLEF